MDRSSAAQGAQQRRRAVPTVADAMISTALLNDSTTTVRDIRTLFDDDHIHAALIVDNGFLVTVVERTDLRTNLRDDYLAVHLGTRHERVIPPDAPLEQARQFMLRSGRRRLAVVDAGDNFRGLLCLKRSKAGFCSDDDVWTRAAEAAEVR